MKLLLLLTLIIIIAETADNRQRFRKHHHFHKNKLQSIMKKLQQKSNTDTSSSDIFTGDELSSHWTRVPPKQKPKLMKPPTARWIKISQHSVSRLRIRLNKIKNITQRQHFSPNQILQDGVEEEEKEESHTIAQSPNINVTIIHDVKSHHYNLFMEHYKRVKNRIKCLTPVGEAICFKDVVPTYTVGTTYIPSCTILHRCSDRTGCCQSSHEMCVASNHTSITLPVYEQIPKLRRHHSRFPEEVSRMIEVQMYNHTKCICAVREKSETPSDLSKCRCPRDFVSIYKKKRCLCECRRHNKLCQQKARGHKLIDEYTQGCIQTRDCQPPECVYGTYRIDLGRCQKKVEIVLKEVVDD